MLAKPAMVTGYWSLLNIASKQIQWILGKALPDITLSKQSITLDSDNLTDTFAIDITGNGIISVSSNDTSIATASLSDTTVTVTAVANGSCTITVSIAESADGNYLSNNITLSVTCSLTQPLANCTPEQIKSIVNKNKAAVNWSIGDTTATITMNGYLSDSLTLSNYQCKAILIGINHNAGTETSFKPSAHFILGKDTSNNEIAFCEWTGTDVYGGNKKSGTWFNHYNSGGSSGGWKSSNLRNTILPKFKDALPSTWQNILGTVTKYTDNTGGSTTADSYVTATSDQLFLLAEYEVFGKQTYANTAEQNNQLQYKYFANGNGKVRYNHQSTSSLVWWWLRSVYVLHAGYFVYVNTDGSVSSNVANYRHGVVPGFAIVKS